MFVIVVQVLVYSTVGVLFVWGVCLMARSHLIMDKAMKEDMKFHFRDEEATKKKVDSK